MERNCKRCNAPFITYPSKTKKGHGRFCSKRCRGFGQYKEALVNRFWRSVAITKSCWIWRGGKRSPRYGGFFTEYGNEYVHRAAWRLMRGRIPEGRKILHTCDNGFCVNPDHLFLGSQRDNMADCIGKGRFYFNTKGRPR